MTGGGGGAFRQDDGGLIGLFVPLQRMRGGRQQDWRTGSLWRFCILIIGRQCDKISRCCRVPLLFFFPSFFVKLKIDFLFSGKM